jgi:hypothetical protein
LKESTASKADNGGATSDGVTSKSEGGALKGLAEASKDVKVILMHLPKDRWGLLGLSIVCATVLAAIVLALKLTPSGAKTQIGFSGLMISASGGPVVLQTENELRLVQFWTPSVDTRSLLCEHASNDEDCIAACQKNVMAGNQWECKVKPEDVDRFDEALYDDFCDPKTEPKHGLKQALKDLWDGVSDEGRPPARKHGTVAGYHRFSEVGRAYNRPEKRGWWWEMTVTKEFDVQEFAKFYIDTWCGKEDRECKEKAVYLEVINGSAGYTASK